MTGFGRSEGVFAGKKISVDIKSLNSKSFDLNVRLPLRYREKEFEVRKFLNDKILRGKVDCYINYEVLDDSSDVNINHTLIKAYMDELKKCAEDGPDFEYLKMAIRLPEAVSTKHDELEDEEWEFTNKIIYQALMKFSEFRKTEGDILYEELKRNLHNIETYLSMVVPYEGVRLEAVKERYGTAVKEFGNIDETRFYQEMAYFTEKLDISEEKVRLAQHLKYYYDVMKNEAFNGKKLGFIAQEIGREINTLGSKANHAEIQKLVVMMKDDLEKIKEQTLNVL